MYTKESLINDLKGLNIKSNDNIMIHSSLKAIGLVEGGGKKVIDALVEYITEGLVMFPTHAWSYIQKDEDLFDVLISDSCVGALTNIARNYPGFARSNHPTHSIVAYGKGNLEYIKKDDAAATPTPVNGCFGQLKDINAKIIFIGASLSKNTFIHSIEEYMDVPLRFTDKKFHFLTKTKNGDIKDYYCYRHFNALCPHISDNYEKLLKPMLELKIAYVGKFGDANTVVVDAAKCHEFVCSILKKDINALSDNRDISSYILY